MPGKRAGEGNGDAPRTDLPPTREPYDDGYFGTGEEEGVVREREASDDEDRDKPLPPASRKVAEDAAGGDREII